MHLNTFLSNLLILNFASQVFWLEFYSSGLRSDISQLSSTLRAMSASKHNIESLPTNVSTLFSMVTLWAERHCLTDVSQYDLDLKKTTQTKKQPLRNQTNLLLKFLIVEPIFINNRVWMFTPSPLLNPLTDLIIKLLQKPHAGIYRKTEYLKKSNWSENPQETNHMLLELQAN